MVMRRLTLFAVLACMVGSVVLAYGQSDSDDESTFRFRFVGPKVGNRVAAVAGVPGDPSTYYAGAASGGVWKSTDGGNRWTPIFDRQPAAAIGSNVPRPARIVSNCLNTALKSKSGSVLIQSNSPFGPAM